MISSSQSDIWRGGYFRFSEEEMRCKCGKCTGLPRHSFMVKLVALRSVLGFPMEVSSGYRCPAHNRTVSATRSSSGPHTLGLAADIKVSRQRAYDLIKEAMLLGFTGIGVNQKGDSRFVHLDTLPEGQSPTLRRNIWSY